MRPFRFSGFIDPLSVRPQAGSWLWEDLVWFFFFLASRIEESVKHDTTRVVPWSTEETRREENTTYLHCPVFFFFYPLRSTEIGYPWPNNIPCPGMDDGWMALFGVTHLVILMYYKLIMLLFSESFLQAPLAIPNRVSPRNKQGSLPLCTSYTIRYNTVEYGTAYSTLRGFLEKSIL